MAPSTAISSRPSRRRISRVMRMMVAATKAHRMPTMIRTDVTAWKTWAAFSRTMNAQPRSFRYL